MSGALSRPSTGAQTVDAVRPKIFKRVEDVFLLILKGDRACYSRLVKICDAVPEHDAVDNKQCLLLPKRPSAKMPLCN
jgi:hypothetical protein